ncbi:MAG: UbiA family prenyltransferase [Methanobacteriaceae archaeon]
MQFDGVQNCLNIILKSQKELNNLFFGKIISFLVLSSLFISINCLLATYFSFLLFNIKPNLNLLLAAFFVTFTIYNLNKLTDKEEDSVNLPERADYVQGNERLLLLSSILSCFTALLLGFLVNFWTIPVILFPFIVGVFYSMRIHPKIPRLKDVVGVKSFIVALSWTVGATFTPAVYSQKATIVIILIFYFFFIKLFVNTILFDVRDIEGDKKSGVKTIPVAIGRSKTKKLLLAIHSSLIPWLVVSMLLGLFTRYLPVLIFCIVYGYWYINHFCNENKKIQGFPLDLLVDGEWLFVAALCFVVDIVA